MTPGEHGEAVTSNREWTVPGVKEVLAVGHKLDVFCDCSADEPGNEATDPDDRSVRIPHHFDCAAVEAWPTVEAMLAQARAEAVAAVEAVSVAFDYTVDASTGMNAGRAHEVIDVEYDPNLAVLGEYRPAPFGTPRIVLREWNEQVLLHELLHVILGTFAATEHDPHGHRTVSRIEVALWDAGWRFRPAVSGTDHDTPTKQGD